jgi:hypothetical protein
VAHEPRYPRYIEEGAGGIRKALEEWILLLHRGYNRQ